MKKETDITVLDVTAIEPKLKHPTIFKLFEELEDGESFIIKNDHDPKPLRYQLLAEKGEIFDWQYLENGLTEWRIKITKKNKANTLSGKSIGDIVAHNPEKIEVFKKYGIDFCCGGDRTLGEACKSANIDEDEIISELNDNSIRPANDQESTFLSKKTKDWNVDFLIDYIINIHHTFLRVHLPEAAEYIEKVANVHGDHHPEVVRIKELFTRMYSILTPHLDYEEEDLFPRIKNLENADDKASETQAILKEIENIISEHEETGNILKEMDALSSHYLTPDDACASYKYIYKSLKEISDDIMIHVHLENNILFKKIN